MTLTLSTEGSVTMPIFLLRRRLRASSCLSVFIRTEYRRPSGPTAAPVLPERGRFVIVDVPADGALSVSLLPRFVGFSSITSLLLDDKFPPADESALDRTSGSDDDEASTDDILVLSPRL